MVERFAAVCSWCSALAWLAGMMTSRFESDVLGTLCCPGVVPQKPVGIAHRSCAAVVLIYRCGSKNRAN